MKTFSVKSYCAQWFNKQAEAENWSRKRKRVQSYERLFIIWGGGFSMFYDLIIVGP